MKKLLPVFTLACAVPVFAAEPDPNPNRIQTDSIDRPVLEAPKTPPAGDTKPGGPSRVVEEKRRGENSGSPSSGGSAASTRGRSLSPDD